MSTLKNRLIEASRYANSAPDQIPITLIVRPHAVEVRGHAGPDAFYGHFVSWEEIETGVANPLDRAVDIVVEGVRAARRRKTL